MAAPDPGTVYQDDLTVPDSERLYRMISAGNTKWEDDVATRAQTNAFQDRREADLPELGVPAVAVSIYLESDMHANGTTPEDLVARWGPKYGVAAITAGEARAQGQGIIRYPQPGEPEHGMIFTKEGPKKSKGQSKNLAASSVIIIAPPHSA